MNKLQLASLLALASMVVTGTALGQSISLFKRIAEEARRKAENTLVERLVQQVQQPPEGPKPLQAENPATSEAQRVYLAPQATVRSGEVPQNLWLNVSSGKKFDPTQGKLQIIAINPYLSPQTPMFASMKGLQCASDGSVIVSGKAGLDADGYAIGQGFWRVAPDGAITPLVSRPAVERGQMPYDVAFAVATDGSMVLESDNALHRISAQGGAERLAGGFSNPGQLIVDGQGGTWVLDQGSKPGNPYCALRRVTADGNVTTVVDADRACNRQLHPWDRVTLNSMAWDSVHGEMVVGGQVFDQKAAGDSDDMYVSVWRVRADGQARRVLKNNKAGHSPVGRNMDGISALGVDAQGRIHIGSRFMRGNATRQVLRLDESSGQLVAETGEAYGSGDYRPGREEYPVDGTAAHANFREINGMCFSAGNTLFVLDDHVLRRVDAGGVVRTWAY